jgi:high-affinity nickel permease
VLVLSLTTEILGLLAVCFFLGIKHSFDVDHVAAVSSFLVRSQKFSTTAKLSITWALGHTLTAGIITIIIFFIKDLFIQNILSHFEIIVAIVLIMIGTLTLVWEYRNSKKSRTSLNNQEMLSEIEITDTLSQTQKGNQISETEIIKTQSSLFLWLKNSSHAILSIGILQGLASNDELFLIFVITLGINNIFVVVFGIAIFSVGVMTGMIFWSSLINLPKIKTKKEIIIKYVNVIIAIVAIAYGVYSLLGGEGINLIPINV